MYFFGTAEGGNLPLYAVSNFSTAAVNCNLWQYAILSAVTKAVGVWTMSMVFIIAVMETTPADMAKIIAAWKLCTGYPAKSINSVLPNSMRLGSGRMDDEHGVSIDFLVWAQCPCSVCR